MRAEVHGRKRANWTEIPRTTSTDDEPTSSGSVEKLGDWKNGKHTEGGVRYGVNAVIGKGEHYCMV